MGKATIASGGAGGDYSINLDFGTATRSATLAAIADYLAQLAPKIADAQEKYNAQKTTEEAVKIEVEGGINGYATAHQALAAAATAENAALVHFEEVASNPLSTDLEKLQSQAQLTAAMAAHTVAKNAIQPALDAYTKAAAKLTEARKKTGALMLPLQNLKHDQAGRLKDQAYWDGIVASATQQAWCADLTENAGGEVSTIEIPGEGNIILIAPGAPAPSAADGVLRAREVQSPEQVFFNAAILPGWQKWQPTYRRGTITALDFENDTANVTLINDVSSAQGLGLNLVTSLTAVPVEYMQCDAEAFDVGDVCVVKFVGQNWDNPKVIGFCDHPKSCGVPLDYIYPDTGASPAMTSHLFKVKIGNDGPVITPPQQYGEVTHGQWWRWSDGVMSRTRQDMNVQASLQVTAQYCSMAKLYLAVVTGNLEVSLELKPISDSSTYSPFGYYKHEVLVAAFATREAALAWRPSPVQVHRWVPELNRTFVMTYIYSAGLDRWEPPADFAAGSFAGQDTPPWP